jgi:NADH-quinone oxidoreductase subunit A
LDVLVVFIYPWATRVRQLGYGAFWAIMVFMGIILVGYLYAWKKGALEWK